MKMNKKETVKVKIGESVVEHKGNLVIIGNKPVDSYYARVVRLVEVDKYTEVVLMSIIPNIGKMKDLMKLLKETYEMYPRDQSIVKDKNGEQMVYYVTQ